MDTKYINPFVEGVSSVFSTMLELNPDRQPVRISEGPTGENVLTSLVGISGDHSGVVALRFPPQTALKLAERFLGAEVTELNDEVIDAIAELTNMVAGSAKAKFNQDPPLELTLPTVVEGAEYRLKYPTQSVWLEVPYISEAGPFSMEVTFSSN